MSKRHQANRRKAYGRRQHEVHERVLRGVHDRVEVRVEAYGRDPDGEPLGFFDGDLGGTRLRFAMGD